ncbi:MAG: hypothetical protein EXR74_08915 [Bdellovibrionales bacterium]|nr:hypothetical protein [Bdellovibrionales bacterium]
MFWADKIVPEEGGDRRTIVVALLIALITGYVLLFYGNELGLGEGAVAIGTLQSVRPIRIRHAKSLQWGTGRTEFTIYLKDSIYTPKNTTAVFYWKDNKIIIDPESLVQFDDASLEKLEITLFEGKIKIDGDSSKGISINKKSTEKSIGFIKDSRAFLPDVNPLILKQSELSARSLDVFGKKLELEPLRAVINPKFTLNRLGDYQILLKTPVNSKTYLYSANSWVDFSWHSLPLENIDYVLEISSTSGFQSIIKRKALEDNGMVLFESSGEFYWRVVANRRVEMITSLERKVILDLKQGEKTKERQVSSEMTSEIKNPSKEKKTAFELFFGEKKVEQNNKTKTGNEKEFKIIFEK